MSTATAGTRWVVILGVTAAITLLDALFTLYLLSYGLEARTQEIAIGGGKLPIPLAWLPLIGVVLVSFVAWYEAYYRIFPRRGFEVDPLGRIRLLRAVVISIALFTCTLFIPYIVGSNWFWARIGETGRSITQVRDFGLSLLKTVESAMLLNQLWQFAASQILAPAAMLFGVWIFGRSARRAKKR